MTSGGLYMVIMKEPPPDNPPKLNDIILMIASLGRFLNRKHDVYLGPKVMWIGLERMKDFALAWQAFYPIDKQTYV